MCRLGFFRSRRAPSPSPSPKWLQLSGPQIGTAGTALARCPPPSRVCLRERKPAHLWNPSLSPRSPLPPVPWELGVSRPHSGALFPLPRSDYNAGSVPSTPPPPAKRPLWWGVAQPRAPGHLLQLDLHKVPTRGALGDSPEAEGQVPLGLLWSQRPKPAEGPCGAWLSGAHPLYRGGGGAGNSDLKLPSQTSPVKLPLPCMILREALSPRPAAEPLDTCGPWDPPTHSLAPDPLLGPYQCLRAVEGQRSKSASTKGPPPREAPCSRVLRYPRHPHPLRCPGSVGVPTCGGGGGSQKRLRSLETGMAPTECQTPILSSMILRPPPRSHCGDSPRASSASPAWSPLCSQAVNHFSDRTCPPYTWLPAPSSWGHASSLREEG